MTKAPSLISRLREGLTTTISVETSVVDCGHYGNFLASPAIDEFLRQRRYLEALRDVAEGLTEYRLTRPQAAAAMNAALDFAPANTRDEIVPTSFDKRSAFPKTAVIQRIAQDLAGTGPIAEQIVVLGELVRELTYGLDFYLVAATRAPDATMIHATKLAEEARTAAERFRRPGWYGQDRD